MGIVTRSSNIIGERISTTRGYIKHPTDGYCSDGDALDAGSMQIIASNLNHLMYESVRPIALDWKTGNLSRLINEIEVARGSGYNDLRDVVAPTGSSIKPWNQISWAVDPSENSNVGVARYYPFLMITDARPDVGQFPTQRWIRCKIRAKSDTTNSLSVAVCVTPWNGTPLNGGIWAPDTRTGFWQTISTTEETKTIDIKPDFLVGSDFPRESFRCEVQGPRPVTIKVYAARLWFGWYSTDPDDYWRSFSAYEYREST